MILNILPINLILRIIIVISGACSVAFLIMAIGQIIHSLWDFLFPRVDWISIPTSRTGRKFNAKALEIRQLPIHFVDLRNNLVRWFWLGSLVMILLIVIFPALHL